MTDQSPYPPYGEANVGPGGTPVPPSPYAGAPPFGYAPQRDNSAATTSLVLGVTGVTVALVGLACYGVISWAAALIGPFAIVQARKAIREIDAEPGVYKNRGLAVAGNALGIVSTILGVLAALALIAVIVLIVTAVVQAPEYN